MTEEQEKWYERETAAFRAWWEAVGEKTYSETPTMAAGAGWLKRAEAASSEKGATVDGVDVPREWPAEALDGPRSEPEALVAWLGTAERFGAEEAIKIMQKRLDRLEEMQRE